MREEPLKLEFQGLFCQKQPSDLSSKDPHLDTSILKLKTATS